MVGLIWVVIARLDSSVGLWEPGFVERKDPGGMDEVRWRRLEIRSGSSLSVASSSWSLCSQKSCGVRPCRGGGRCALQ